MQALQYDLDVAADRGQFDDLRYSAIDSILSKTFISPLTILPTPEVDGTEETAATTPRSPPGPYATPRC